MGKATISFKIKEILIGELDDFFADLHVRVGIDEGQQWRKRLHYQVPARLPKGEVAAVDCHNAVDNDENHPQPTFLRLSFPPATLSARAR